MGQGGREGNGARERVYEVRECREGVRGRGRDRDTVTQLTRRVRLSRRLPDYSLHGSTTLGPQHTLPPDPNL